MVRIELADQLSLHLLFYTLSKNGNDIQKQMKSHYMCCKSPSVQLQ